MNKKLATFLALQIAGTGLRVTHAQTQTPNPVVPFALTGTSYTQNFDSNEAPPNGPGLATAATNGGTSSQVPPGWGFVEGDTNANTTYVIDNGGASGGNTYSYGTTNTTDRAFGSLASGTLEPITRGAIFTNSTGSTITSLTITYTGEEWRGGTANSADVLSFSYNPSASLLTGNLTSGTWTAVAALDFTTPNAAATGALDGNAAANRTVGIAATITGLNIGIGQSFGIRWIDADSPNTDDGLAIDDLTMTLGTTPIPEPSTFAAGMITACVLLAFQRRRLVRLVRS